MTEEDTFEALQLRIVIGVEGTKRYYNTDNQLHRKFGPAVVWSDGNEYWYLNDEYHRTDGPAINRADGSKEWFLNGKRLSEAEFLKHPFCTIK